MNDKIFEKINVKVVISIEHCTAVQNFGQYGELQILGPNLDKKV